MREKAKKNQSPFLFRTYENVCPVKGRNPGPAHDIPIWQAARATSAAPTYFKEILIEDIKFIDGGFGTNNPCHEVIKEVRGMNNLNNDCIRCVISIGTGLKIQQHVSRPTKLKSFWTANLANMLVSQHSWRASQKLLTKM